MNQLQSFIDLISHPIFLSSSIGKVEIFNKKFYSLFLKKTDEAGELNPKDFKKGIKYSDFLTDEIFEIFVKNDELLLSNKNPKDQKIRESFEISNRKKLDFVVKRSLYFIEDKKFILNVFENRSPQKALKKALKDKRERDRINFMYTKNVAFGELLSNISHHWRQPLSTISLSLCNIRDMVEEHEDVEMIDERIDEIQDEIQFLSGTISKFQKYFKQKDSKRFNLQSALKDASELIAYELYRKPIEVKLDIDSSIYVVGDLNEFRQTILSILQNSLESIVAKYKDDTKNGTIEITSYKKDKRAILNISDNGVGISQEGLLKVFDPYYTTKFESRNVGLSLFVAKNSIEQLGGKIAIANNKKKGVDVIIELPLES